MAKRRIRVRGLFLNITTMCNMQCKGCYGHLDDFPPSFMSLDTAKKATEIFFKNRNTPEERRIWDNIIMFWGGEPTMNFPLIERYVEWMDSEHPRSREDYRFAIVTNGVALDKGRIEYLMSNGIETFISIDGPYDVQYIRRQIPEDVFQRIVDNIKIAVDKDPGDLVSSYTVLRRENIPRMEEILDYLHSLGLQRIALAKDFFQEWTFEEKKYVLQRLMKWHSIHGDVAIIAFPESVGSCVSCMPKYMMVYPNGEIYDLCYVSGTVILHKGLISAEDLEIFRFGNVDDTTTLYFDVEAKARLMRPRLNCTILRRYFGPELRELASRITD